MKRSEERSAFSDQRSAGGGERRGFAEEPIGVDQTGFERQSTPRTAGCTPIEGRDDRFAEESSSVDQGRPAKAGTPTSGTVAEEPGAVDQRRPAKAGTPTSDPVAEKAGSVDQRLPAKAGTPTSGTVAEEPGPVDQEGRTQASAELAPYGAFRVPHRTKIVWA